MCDARVSLFENQAKLETRVISSCITEAQFIAGAERLDCSPPGRRANQYVNHVTEH